MTRDQGKRKDEVVRAAYDVWQKELFDKEVAEQVAELRALGQRPWWRRLFPWTITITRSK